MAQHDEVHKVVPTETKPVFVTERVVFRGNEYYPGIAYEVIAPVADVMYATYPNVVSAQNPASKIKPAAAQPPAEPVAKEAPVIEPTPQKSRASTKKSTKATSKKGASS